MDTRFAVHVTSKWYMIAGILGATVSLFSGCKTLAGGEKGVLSVFDSYTENLGDPGLYWELPGIIGIKLIGAKITPAKITLLGPKLKGSVTLTSATGTITYEIANVAVAVNVEDIPAIAKALCESAMRTFISTQRVEDIENGKVDLRSALSRMDVGNGRTRCDELDAEAAEVGLRIKSIYLDSAEVPKALVDAKNQQAIELAEREAQQTELAFRQGIMQRAMADGASYAEAQAEADRVTGKKSTVTTTQITGTGGKSKKGGPQPVVILGQNNQGDGS
ncbi:MAG: hypothetical protein WAV09_01900 [Minisyncoccia bacterium]